MPAIRAGRFCRATGQRIVTCPAAGRHKMVVACTAPKPVAWRVNWGGLRILLYFLLGWIVLFVAVAVVASH
jgi:hypothetical protein